MNKLTAIVSILIGFTILSACGNEESNAEDNKKSKRDKYCFYYA